MADPTPREEPDPGGGSGSAFRQPHFTQYWISNILQGLAAGLQMLASQWLITSLTTSRTLLGLVGFVQGIIVAFSSPLAGVAADRFAKRDLMLAGRVGALLVLGILIALVAADVIRMWHIIVTAALLGFMISMIQPASQTYVFDIVGRTRLQNAVAVNAAGAGIAQLGGPALAGVLIATIGILGTYISGAGGEILSIALLATIPIRGKSERTQKTSAWSDLREGFRYVARERAVFLVLVACSMAIFNGALFSMRTIFARFVLKVGSRGFGVMGAAAGAGTMTGAVIASFMPRITRPGTAIVVAMLLFGTTVFLYSFAFSFTYILVIEFLNGLSGQMWSVATFAGLQMAVPEAMRGRVISLVWMVIQLAPIGNLLVGALADAIGDQLALGIFGAIPMVILSLLLLFGWKTLWSLQPLDEATAS